MDERNNPLCVCLCERVRKCGEGEGSRETVRNALRLKTGWIVGQTSLISSCPEQEPCILDI